MVGRISSLDRKLLRDLWKMKGQVLAIALVITCGVAAFIMMISTMDSLNVTREKFYREYRFAEAFASLKRAPEGLKEQIREIPGVNIVETRVVADVKLDIRGFEEPVTARLVSLPEESMPLLNGLFIRKGRLPEPWSEREVVVSESFADAHGFSPGDSFGAVINGRWKNLVITGTVLSPEFVLQTRPGAISPDYKRYGILWMRRTALGTAYNMDGAFNDVVISVARGAHISDTLQRLDEIIDRYGGIGSYARKDQISHRFLSEEFNQLKRYAEIFPALFIGVSAFLLNVVISRIILTQRDQIAILKAFGYTNLSVGMHYFKMVVFIVLIGIACGLGVGIWMGQKMAGIYMDFYRFPYLIYVLKPSVAITAALITLASAAAGTLMSVRKAVVLPPAEAMRPEQPVLYRKTLLDRIGIGRFLSHPMRIVIRNIERRPLKAFFTITGTSLSCAIMLGGTFSWDAVDFMMDVQFTQSQKEDMTVTFTEPTSRKAVYDLKNLHGVVHAEIFRSVPVRFRFGNRSYRTSIQGVEPGNRLSLLLDDRLKPFTPPPEGIVLNDYLGKILGVRPGDMLTVEILEGSRPVRQVPVVSTAKQYIGLTGYMDLTALNRMMREDDTVSGALITIDSRYQQDIYRRLVTMPRVATTVVRRDEIRNFYATQAEAILFFTLITSILAGSIAFGVVYNSARIALSERGRELASLRVLGYTRAEISYIFLGELGLLTLAAIPVGFILGNALCTYIADMVSSDLFRIPVVIESSTYSLAATVVLVSACLSGLIVRHRLDHLDLIAVLKTKE